MAVGIRVVCSKCRAAYRIESGVEPGEPVACPKCEEKSILPAAQDAETAPIPASLAGSPDDREVTLAPVTRDESTGVWEGKGAGPSVEAALRAADAASGRYIEQGVIGKGGMGEIVLCIDRDIRRSVAMKRMLTATASDPSRRARFIEEAQVTGQLEHPNIVPVHELARNGDGTVYFTMKLVKGRSLADILRERKETDAGRPTSPPAGSKSRGRSTRDCPPAGEETRGRGSNQQPSLGDLLQVFLKVCDGVAFAHSRGVIHRDLKPANIMVGDYGEVLVMDWGLAKVVGREDIRAQDIVETTRAEKAETRTLEGSVVGTPAYMPPEQAEGKMDQIDERSDTYSLGAILYEMLTLERAVEGDNSWQVMANVVNGRITPPEERTPGRQPPRELSAIAMKCLSRSRAHRYASVLALRRDIGLYLEGRSVSAAPDTFAQALVKLVKRNRALVVGVAGVFVALVLGIIGTTTGLLRAQHAQRLAESRQKESEAARGAEAEERQRAEGAEKTAMRRLWQSCLSQARAGRWSRRAGQRFDSLNALSEAAKLVPLLGLGDREVLELRNEAIACLSLPDLRVAKRLRLDPPLAAGVWVSFDATLERYARCDAHGNVLVHSVADGRRLAHVPGFGVPLEWVFRFSPDGRFFAAKYQRGDADALHIWDLGRREVALKVPVRIHTGAMDFSPDSRCVAVGEPDGSVHLYDLASGKELKSLSSERCPHALCFDPEGRKLAVSSARSSTVSVHDLGSGEAVKTFAHSAGVRGVAWSRDGRRLATACADGRVGLWDTETGEARATLEGHRGVVTDVAFNQAGDLLASYGWDGTTRLWDPIGGRPLLSVPGQLIGRFSPDDRLWGFTVTGREVGIWDVVSGRECAVLGKGGAWSAAISPDGHLLATADDDGIRLWDLAGRRRLAYVSDAGSRSVLFHPDGKRLIASGWSGVRCWPIRLDPTGATAAVQIGAPQMLGPAGRTEFAALSSDGQTLAVAYPSGLSQVLPLGQPGQPIVLRNHPGSTTIALSPDGQWVATGTWKGTGVKVWDARTGNLVRTLPVRGNATVSFSPDGRWLATGAADEYRLWEAGSWQPGPGIVRELAVDVWGQMAFAPDGTILAVMISRDRGLQLIDPGTGRVLAALDAGPQTPRCFSPDGSQLVVSDPDGSLHLWDLRRVRRQLAAMGLDWGSPR